MTARPDAYPLLAARRTFSLSATATKTEQRLYCLPAWRETSFYSDRERAALAWTEAVTEVAESHVPDAVFEQARRHFSGDELAHLTLAVVASNGWNRLAIAFRAVPGTYQPGQIHARNHAEPAVRSA